MTLTPDSVTLDEVGMMVLKIGSCTLCFKLHRQQVSALQRGLRRQPDDLIEALQDSVTLALAERAVLEGM